MNKSLQNKQNPSSPEMLIETMLKYATYGDKWGEKKEKERKDCFYTSIMAITLSLCVLSTCITFSHVERKLPSIPLTSIALTSILVRRKGT